MAKTTENTSAQDLKYLRCLSELFPNIASASTEIINLQSILNLPKGTEHFISDIHGEYAAFSHVLKNGSGAIRKKIDDVFGHTLDNTSKHTLATLIYYPKEKMRIEKQKVKDIDNWYHVTLYRLIEICKVTASKYTRSHVRKALPPKYAYVIEELITEKPEVLNKESYYDSIVDTIIEIGQAEPFIVALCELIQVLVISRLHILGDIFDRGPAPHRIMDDLMNYHSLDIQWGNHDVVWMGAAAGQTACIATVIRNCVRYGNLDVLEDGYGINLLPLVTFAIDTYHKDPCKCFPIPRGGGGSDHELRMDAKTHKAITIIQLKLEGQLIQKHPEFGLDNRLLLDKIDITRKKITIDGKEYDILDDHFPTIDWEDPYRLSPEEEEVVNRLQTAFLHCEKLQKHVELLLNKGSIYKVYNGNLLYHGCVPLTPDGNFLPVNIYGKTYSGKDLYDALDIYIREAFSSIDEEERDKGRDIMWFIWCSPTSPLFGKDKMATLESYLVADKSTHVEKKNPYYQRLEEPQIADMILKEFGLEGEHAHIINGHVPVHLKEGESPVKCGGKVLVIDGGFSKPYQKVTGIAGYTLIYNSYGLFLAAHEPFVTTEQAILQEADIISNREVVYLAPGRRLMKDTDSGQEISQRIEELKALLKAYRNGSIKERENTLF